MSFFDISDATFNPNLEKINPTDRVHADIPNKRFNQLINNDVFIKEVLDIHNHNEYLEKEELMTSLVGVVKETE